ncbi:SUF system Fe-S cluster assembly regulator [Marinobacterium arenosum]|uniref:SUF system Fe-S cluster assembly regulator n=1 Tax=Marinobacterium arenosum TaxID=2862496 RepID=UPI001C971EE1|nr:SUF system Fe-S cluster assembly regulator [Marinobacterium arenosum]MBY4678866.1 SUF system Fe-S cluster assembly regulator [Marinobacterium arenosum]
MLRVSKLTDYGTVVLARMAREPERTFSAAALAEAVALPVSTVRKLLKVLTRHGLLNSCRGQQGGYQLARPPQRISLADIIEALEGPLGLTECSFQHGLCQLEARCHIRSQWQDVNQVIYGALARVSLVELLAKPSNKSIALLNT